MRTGRDLTHLEIELKKKVTGILSLISTIASYSKCKNDNLERITYMANILSYLGMDFLHEYFCNEVNAIRFDFTKKDFHNSAKNRPYTFQSKIIIL
jgi:hypothetical protein